VNPIVTFLDLACGKRLTDSEAGPARRMQIVAGALLFALVFAALWGVAAGSRSTPLAIANLYKVPMVVLVSAVSAVPAGLLAWKLSGAPGRASDLLLSFSSSIFGGTLVLAVAAPLVALYYHSSLWAGPVLGQGSALLAIAVGALMFARGAFGQRPAGGTRRSLVVPVVTFAVVQLAMLVQLVALAAPILPERTFFSHGIDRAVTQ
jgi:hypothetical protein